MLANLQSVPRLKTRIIASSFQRREQEKQDVNRALIRVKEPDRCDAEGHSCRCCFVVDPKGNPRQGHDHDGGDVRLCYKQT